MGFDDLARHMKARDGGKLSAFTDPNLMMVEAGERAQSSERTSGLVLGPLLVVGGLVMLVLALSVHRVASEAQLPWWWIYIWPAGAGAVIVGGIKLWRGLFGTTATATDRAAS